jgi:hypothetical protein
MSEVKFKIVEDSSCEEGEISIEEHADCEHCGKLEPFDINISDGGTYWCECCGTMEYEIPEDILKEAKEISKQRKIEYYKQRIEALENS